MLHILCIVTLELGPIRPLHLAKAMHAPSMPLAHVASAICKPVRAFAMHSVGIKLSFVICPLVSLIVASAVFAALLELSNIPCSIWILFYAPSSFLISYPLAFVRHAIF